MRAGYVSDRGRVCGQNGHAFGLHVYVVIYTLLHRCCSLDDHDEFYDATHHSGANNVHHIHDGRVNDYDRTTHDDDRSADNYATSATSATNDRCTGDRPAYHAAARVRACHCAQGSHDIEARRVQL